MDGKIFYGQFPAVQIPIAEVKIVMHLWKAYYERVDNKVSAACLRIDSYARIKRIVQSLVWTGL